MSSVTCAAIASVLAMTAFVITAGTLPAQAHGAAPAAIALEKASR
ncbi:hypothetical protein [Novosphingobium album (ex Liu et al. 2023)]|nr:hypothetical protein [Novosphingobium album (ex Liu et al. 2023)]